MTTATGDRLEMSCIRRTCQLAAVGTLIVVAHRISSAQRADRILLLDGVGAVLGTPDELPERSPLYAELLGYWRSGTPTRPSPR